MTQIGREYVLARLSNTEYVCNLGGKHLLPRIDKAVRVTVVETRPAIDSWTNSSRYEHVGLRALSASGHTFVCNWSGFYDGTSMTGIHNVWHGSGHIWIWVRGGTRLYIYHDEPHTADYVVEHV